MGCKWVVAIEAWFQGTRRALEAVEAGHAESGFHSRLTLDKIADRTLDSNPFIASEHAHSTLL